MAYADKSELSKAHKVWFPETEPAKTCARFGSDKVDRWILTASQDKFVPDETLRFATLETYLQMAIPHGMVKTMKVCAKCYPKTEAMKMQSDFPRVDWKTSAYTGANTLAKRDLLDARAAAAAACPAKASSSASRSKATPTTLKATPTTKVKVTPTSKPKITPTAKPSKTKTKKTKTKTKKTKTKTKKIKTKKPKKPRATGVVA